MRSTKSPRRASQPGPVLADDLHLGRLRLSLRFRLHDHLLLRLRAHRPGGAAAAGRERQGEADQRQDRRRAVQPAAMPNRRGIAAALADRAARHRGRWLRARTPKRPLPGSGRVLVVGDSLEELTSPYLEALLPGVPMTVNAVGGSNSFEIFDLFEESYDPPIQSSSSTRAPTTIPTIRRSWPKTCRKWPAMVGERCLVVPTILGFTVNGVDNAGKNRVVAEFAASRPGTQTPDWAGQHRPAADASDHLHPNEKGAQSEPN